jgi:hypothetical protein
MGIEVSDFLEKLNRGRHIARVECIAAAQQQSVAVAGIERNHALQNFFRWTQLTFASQGLGRRGKDLPGFSLLA